MCSILFHPGKQLHKLRRTSAALIGGESIEEANVYKPVTFLGVENSKCYLQNTCPYSSPSIRRKTLPGKAAGIFSMGGGRWPQAQGMVPLDLWVGFWGLILASSKLSKAVDLLSCGWAWKNLWGHKSSQNTISIVPGELQFPNTVMSGTRKCSRNFQK